MVPLFLAIIQTPQKSPVKNDPNITLDQTTMVIKVAGQEYCVTNTKKQHNKSHSLGSLSEFKLDLEKTKTNDDTIEINHNTTINNEQNKENCNDETVSEITENNFNVVNNSKEENLGLSKSKSEGNPFNHKKKGKILKLTERPRGNN